MTTGELLREEGADQVLDNEGDSLYRRTAELALTDLINAKIPFSVNDVHDRIKGSNVTGHHPNVLGAIFKTASHHKRMVRTGNMVSPNKATSHARPVAEWIASDSATTPDLERYRKALIQIVTLTELAKKTAELPGNRGQDFHAGQLALVRDIDRIVDNS